MEVTLKNGDIVIGTAMDIETCADKSEYLILQLNGEKTRLDLLDLKCIPKLLGTEGFQREFKWSNTRHLLKVMVIPLSK